MTRNGAPTNTSRIRDVVFRHACKLDFEGIMSKRLGSVYRSGRSRDWLKFKNPRHGEARGGRGMGKRWR
jgi:ATP-dependent DNA ligase